jgi:SAGA-associated factor 29
MPLASGNSRSVSITVPPRTNSVGPVGHSRDSRNKKDASYKPPILQPERKVAFRPPPSTQSSQEDSTWIMAIVTKYLGSDKQGPKYEVQDAEPQDDGQPGA